MALILILGASRGLGRALAEAYLAQGHQVIATVRKAEDMVELQARGARVLQVGAGGAGTAIALALLALGLVVSVFDMPRAATLFGLVLAWAWYDAPGGASVADGTVRAEEAGSGEAGEVREGGGGGGGGDGQRAAYRRARRAAP